MRERALLPFVLGAVAVAFVFVFVAPAFAESHVDECIPFADAVGKVLNAARGDVEDKGDLTMGELDFARGMAAATPPVGGYPHDRHGALFVMPDGSSAIVFHADGMSCDVSWMTADMTAVLVSFGQREQAP